ncbi:hypothetical protein GCM10010269_00200 [Streptomyces humidus]|uniref:Uncharacterized protein n=1 Tax=Streptomyces humidus TaxID=52259 RepID=A0A918L0E9_9ACTN|nr:hypothetical protein [Streptomyces humidus]GGR65685.1 hypothetical protein GCM10010269_00200 [Streptomyces humidus]
MTAEHDGRGGPDALMAAIADEPLPDEARADAAFMAEHRSAAADVALLREQLGVLADALAEPVRESAARPAPAPLRRSPARRLRPLLLGAVGVAAAGALVLGTGWAVVRTGQGASDDAGSKSAPRDAGRVESGGMASEDAGALLGDPGYLACTRLVVEGDVTGVRRLPGTTRERVSLRVTHAYRPARSAPEVGVDREQNSGAPLNPGDHVLVALARGTGVSDVWVVGEPDIAHERRALAEALPATGPDAVCE